MVDNVIIICLNVVHLLNKGVNSKTGKIIIPVNLYRFSWSHSLNPCEKDPGGIGFRWLQFFVMCPPICKIPFLVPFKCAIYIASAFTLGSEPLQWGSLICLVLVNQMAATSASDGWMPTYDEKPPSSSNNQYCEAFASKQLPQIKCFKNDYNFIA